jgi:hypothetical protein
MADGRTPAGQQPVRDEPTLGRLVANASRDLSLLIRSEIELAKSEIRVDMRNAFKGGGMFGGAGFFGMLAVILLSIAAAYGLTALGLHPGFAFLIVGGVYLLIAGGLGLTGQRSVKKVGPPERTIRTAKESMAALTSRRPGARSDGRSAQQAAPTRGA